MHLWNEVLRRELNRERRQTSMQQPNENKYDRIFLPFYWITRKGYSILIQTVQLVMYCIHLIMQTTPT